MSSGNISTVPIKANLYAQWMSSGYINTVPRNMNPSAQWLSHCITPSGIKVPEIIKLISPVAILIYTPSGNIDIVILI